MGHWKCRELLCPGSIKIWLCLGAAQAPLMRIRQHSTGLIKRDLSVREVALREAMVTARTEESIVLPEIDRAPAAFHSWLVSSALKTTGRATPWALAPSPPGAGDSKLWREAWEEPSGGIWVHVVSNTRQFSPPLNRNSWLSAPAKAFSGLRPEFLYCAMPQWHLITGHFHR